MIRVTGRAVRGGAVTMVPLDSEGFGGIAALRAGSPPQADAVNANNMAVVARRDRRAAVIKAVSYWCATAGVPSLERLAVPELCCT